MLIGISGKIGSGKDTVAYLIVQHALRHDNTRKWEIRKFADRLKETVSTLTNTPTVDSYSRLGKQTIPAGFSDSLGVLQQKVGMALREHIDPNVWINIALHDVKHRNVIVADVRFRNEAEAIRQLGGLVIRVNGDPTDCRPDDSRDLNHPSETDLDNWPNFDHVITNNNNNLEELSKIVQEWVTKEIKK
jgi:hypothetical protein